MTNILRLAKTKHRFITNDRKTWPMLAAPVLVEESERIMRARSLLSGPIIGACPPLTIEQANDVLRWYKGELYHE